jgi:perosamine synthetase
MVREFERALEAQLGLVRPVALNSGTSALHLALALCGIGPGDEVLLPPQTFVATGLVVLMQGARPVFCDIDPLTGNLCPESLARKITPRSRAVMPVHWGGYPCDLDEINRLAGQHGLHVIEDAAHALGATYRGRPIGAVSALTAFSFQAIKHLTTGDGGALCCLDLALTEQARARRWFGIDRERDLPSLLGERVYDLTTVGYKYHLNDLGAAVGLGNLADFPGRLRRRQRIAARYRAELHGVPDLRLLRAEPDRTSACWIFTLRVRRREDFIRRLFERGVPASVVHLRIDENRVFGGAGDLPGQAEFNAEQVALPVHEGLTDDDVARVIAAVRAGW